MYKYRLLFQDFVSSPRGQVFVDVYRIRNSFFWAVIWAAYILLARIDFAFRGIEPSLAWLATVGLPLSLGDQLPLYGVVGYLGLESVLFLLYAVLPFFLWMICFMLVYLFSVLFVLVGLSSDRRRIMALAAIAALSWDQHPKTAHFAAASRVLA